MLSRSFRSALYLTILLTTAIVGIAKADNGKSQEREIAEAKEAFRGSVDSAKKQLQERLDAKLAFAQRRGELELTETVSKELEAFKTKGILPTTVPADGYVTTLQRALGQLEVAYDQVIRSYVREGLLDDARFLKEEFAAFKASSVNHPEYANAVFSVVSGASKPQELKNGAKAFLDRTYTWGDIPKDFPCRQFAPIRGEGQDPIVIQVKSPGIVYIALNNEHPQRVAAFLRNFDWKPTEAKMSHSARGKTPVYVFQRVYETGEHIIPRVNFSGPTLLLP